MIKRHLQMVVSLLLASGLAACGGGGASVPGSVTQLAGPSASVQSGTSINLSQTRGMSSQYAWTQASGTSAALAIDAGASASIGNWSADSGANGGWVSSTTNVVDTSRAINPAPQVIYQTQRVSKSLIYSIASVKPNAAYTVRLHFAETFFKAAKQRLFTVTINGVQALSNFDIFHVAGGGDIAIVEEVATHADATGHITLAFVATVDNASIAGFEIVGATNTPAPSPSPTMSAGVLALNAGGAANGSWLADADYNGGQLSSSTQAIDTSKVPNAPPASIYQTQRFSSNLTYAIPNRTPLLAYTVQLHFAETYFSGPGMRIFGIKINGLSVLKDFDVFQAAGGRNIAVMRQFVTTADANGKITISFLASVNNASVAGIEIAPSASGIGPTPSPVPSVTPTPSPSPTPTVGGSNWPAAGWVPYKGGALTVPVGVKPSYAADSSTVVNTLWSGRSSDAGQLRVYSGPPPPPSNDYSPDVLYFGKASDPIYTISCYQYGGNCRASGIAVHIPRGAYPAGGTDAHIDIRDTVTGKDIMLWEAPVPNGRGGTYAVGWGTVIDSNSEGLNAVGSTASGMSAIWSLREVDLARNTINHAILVSINGESPDGYSYPAVGWDNGYFKTNYPKMGAHFWLDVPPSQLPSNCPAYAVSYLTALNKYGAYFSLYGGINSVFGIQAESDMSYTYNGGASVWGPFMASMGLRSSGVSQLAIANCGIDMQMHMHVLNPPSPS